MRGKNASIGFIFFTVLVDVIGLGIIIPVTPELIKSLSEVNTSEASQIGGFLIFAFTVSQFLFAPLLGVLSDKFGRRRILLLALFGLGLDYFFHAFAPTLTWLFVGRILGGITGASITVARAYIADVSAPEEKAKNYGIIGAAFGLGFTVGPLIGGVSGELYGVKAPFIIAGVLTMLNFLFGLFVLPESLTHENRREIDYKKANPFKAIAQLKHLKVLRNIFLMVFIIYVGQHAVHSVWNYYTIYKFQWEMDMVGYSLAASGVLVSIVQAGLVRVFIRQLGEWKTIILGMFLWGLGMLLFGLATNQYMMFVYLIPFCMGGIAGPSIQAVLSNRVAKDRQGELQGTYTSIQSLSNIIGPVLMTTVFRQFTSVTNEVPVIPGMPYYLGAGLLGVAVVIGVVMKRITESKNELL